jgi:2-C-methyl-D-erythritol 4-phosphate cytidylyltransferase/2-C-methyl-D-erythritol 2,4-cyclodiphosphate synthase
MVEASEPATETSPAPATGGPYDVIVVAAGSSRRMAGADKLEAPLDGRPLLARTLDAVAAAPGLHRVVVVTAADRVDRVAAAAWLPGAVVAVVAGGRRRQASVAAGLRALDALDADARPDPGDHVVLVHDGARPLVAPALFRTVADAAAVHGAAIPVLPMAETVKRIADGRVVETVDRAELATAQTPQGFRRSVLHAAYARLDPEGPDEWTDEASLCESCTIPVHVVPGHPSNLKVTQPDDLVRARAMLAAAPGVRVGFGRDSHPFGPGSPLALGGIQIEGAPRLHGHSDGDVALHAVADALLGAAGLGDLGRLFPAGPATPRGIASGAMLGFVLERVAEAGLRLRSADLTIVGARPRLADRLVEMRDVLSSLLGLPPGSVGVKASTGNLSGDEGAGRSMSAEAVVVLEARQ